MGRAWEGTGRCTLKGAELLEEAAELRCGARDRVHVEVLVAILVRPGKRETIAWISFWRVPGFPQSRTTSFPRWPCSISMA